MEKSGYSAMRSSISCPMERAACCNAPAARRANVAVGVARLGGDSGFIGRVGDDPFGRFMRHTLAQEQSGCELYAPRCGAAHLHGGGRSR